MTATTRGSPVGGNDSQGQGQAPDAQSQPPLPQNQVSGILLFSLSITFQYSLLPQVRLAEGLLEAPTAVLG